MRLDKTDLLLYAVTDRGWVGKFSFYEQIEMALKGGVTCVQLREKNIEYDEFLKEALIVKKLCSKYRIPFIVNDNVDIAVTAGADGVHIGQGDVDLATARKKIGNKIIGVSVENKEQAKTAEAEGADYLGAGAVFPTLTKKDAADVDKNTLKEICSSVNIPVVAIGGITESNILHLKQSGCSGVAVVSAIFSKNDITDACRRLLKLSKEVVLLED